MNKVTILALNLIMEMVEEDDMTIHEIRSMDEEILFDMLMHNGLDRSNLEDAFRLIETLRSNIRYGC